MDKYTYALGIPLIFDKKYTKCESTIRIKFLILKFSYVWV